MHDPNSPHFQFDPSSVGWLHRRVQQGDAITNEDLACILEANPELVQDAIFRKQVLLALRGELQGVRGRPTRPPLNDRDLAMLVAYEDLLPRLQAWSKKPNSTYHGYADGLAPAEYAYELIARRVKMLTGGRVRNIISSLKKHGI